MEQSIYVKYNDHVKTFNDYLDAYLNIKSPDCILYSQDGSEFKIHKEIFSQTHFQREILSIAKEDCMGTLEILCPCTKEELSQLVDFLYCGEIKNLNESESIKFKENLIKIFGYPENICLINQNSSLWMTQVYSTNIEEAGMHISYEKLI